MNHRPDSCPDSSFLSRRRFLAASAFALFSGPALAQRLAGTVRDPIIDVHQHVLYDGRPDQQLIEHQRTMGATLSVLLPSGDRGPGHTGGSNESDEVYALAKRLPDEFVFFANEISDHPNAVPSIEKQLKAGAIGIGEQKFLVDCDSIHMDRIAEVARDYGVPILMHFSQRYNRGFERFHRMLEKHSSVTFIGHATTWWGNIDKNYQERSSYPDGPVTSGGLTDQYLSDYANCYADVSANSGYTAFARDEEHARDFIVRHQDKLIFGSDCHDSTGTAPECIGARTLALFRKLAPVSIQEKVFYRNAQRVLKL